MSLENDKYDAFLKAIYEKSLAEMRALIDEGSSINGVLNTKDLNSLLQLAVNTKFVGGVKLLLDMGADVTYNNENVLNVAPKVGNIEIVQILLKNAADQKKFDCYYWKPLYTGIISLFESGIEILLETGVNVNGRDRFGNTPLHCALLGFKKLIHPEPIDMTISGTEMKSMNKSHEVAHIRNNRIHACKILIERGAFIDSQNNYGYTPLHIAVMKGYDSIVELLLKSGAKVNKSDFVGWTPLHHVSVVDNRYYFRLLLEKGASLDIESLSGKTPLDLNRNVSLWFEELERLRAKKIRSLTLYDVFRMPTHKYTIIGNSKKIKAVVLSWRFIINHPLYGPSIKNIVTSAITRCALLDKAQYYLTPVLPVEMKLCILSFLSNEDLRKFTRAFLAP